MDVKIFIDSKNITQYCETITWGGNLQQTSRTLTAKMVRQCRPKVGQKATFYVAGKRVFIGKVVFVDCDSKSNSIECYDIGMYLANNEMYKEYKGTAQSITKQVCSACGVKIGKLANRLNKTKVTSTGSMSAFKVIEEAYEGKRKHAKQYSYRIDANNRLTVEKAGADTVAKIDVKIINAKRSSSIKNMVNRVVILSDKNKMTGSVENAANCKKYGTMQKTYKKQKGKNDKAEARDLLRGVEKTGSVESLGNVACISGKAVIVTEKKTGLTGKQIISSDKHTFTPAGYTMSLEFYYD